MSDVDPAELHAGATSLRSLRPQVKTAAQTLDPPAEAALIASAWNLFEQAWPVAIGVMNTGVGAGADVLDTIATAYETVG
ncbi:MAG: hypothetical protein LBM66_07160 [Bifidobacteriaceae bacterium]|jgi:hypothetical protein|nr:hypothetical protein [Bifidobacteriaceae bacterium]